MEDSTKTRTEHGEYKNFWLDEKSDAVDPLGSMQTADRALLFYSGIHPVTYRIDLNTHATSAVEASLAYITLSAALTECLKDISDCTLRIASGEHPAIIMSTLLRLQGVMAHSVEFESEDQANAILTSESGSKVLAAFKSSTTVQNVCLGLIAVVNKTVLDDATNLGMFALLDKDNSLGALEGASIAYAELNNLMTEAPEIALKIAGSDTVNIIYKVIDAYVFKRLSVKRQEFAALGGVGYHAIGVLEGVITHRSTRKG